MLIASRLSGRLTLMYACFRCLQPSPPSTVDFKLDCTGGRLVRFYASLLFKGNRSAGFCTPHSTLPTMNWTMQFLVVM